MAPAPTDLEAWEALQGYAPDLDKVRKPKELKEAMHDIVSRTWDMSESRLDFVDFGVIWIDQHVRKLVGKLGEIGPGRETFNMATYRTLKTSRLEGYWDVLLENLADWIETFAKGFRRSVTLDDYEKLLGCMPPSRNLKTYRMNIKNLFWPLSGQRARGFLSQLTAAAYEEAFNTILTSPPDDGWNLKLIMNQIHDKGIVCKSVMLHVGFWFNPDLEEPANRANVKPPMFEHLKLAFSNYHDPSHPMYEADDTWKPQALELQRVVLKFTLQWWPKSNAIIGNLGMLRDMSPQRYADYIRTDFWNRLLREVREQTNVPFRHPSLVRYKTVNDLPPGSFSLLQIPDEAEINEFRGRVGNIIRDEDDDRRPVDSEEGEESLEGENDSTFASKYSGGDGLGYPHADSPPPEALAVESEDERDIIHVQTPSPVHSNPSKRRKVHTNEYLGYVPVYNDQYAIPQKPLRKIVKLKISQDGYVGRVEQSLVDRPRNPARKRPITHNSPGPQPVQEPSPTISAPSNAPPSRATPAMMTPIVGTEPTLKNTPRASIEQQSRSEQLNSPELDAQRPEPLIQPIPLDEAARERETARRALDECEGKTRPNSSRAEDSEERLHISDQPFHRPRKHNFPPTGRTSTPNAPTPSPAPPSLPHQSYFAQTPAAASPALSTNKTEQAILVLQDEFGETLQIGEMLAAIKFLKNDLEAGIFLTLKPGALRNAWLWDGIKDNIRAL